MANREVKPYPAAMRPEAEQLLYQDQVAAAAHQVKISERPRQHELHEQDLLSQSRVLDLQLEVNNKKHRLQLEHSLKLHQQQMCFQSAVDSLAAPDMRQTPQQASFMTSTAWPHTCLHLAEYTAHMLS